MRFAIEAGCVPGAIKLLRRGFADRTKEGPGQRSILIHFLVRPASEDVSQRQSNQQGDASG
jgi:hypothetical protein